MVGGCLLLIGLFFISTRVMCANVAGQMEKGEKERLAAEAKTDKETMRRRKQEFDRTQLERQQRALEAQDRAPVIPHASEWQQQQARAAEQDAVNQRYRAVADYLAAQGLSGEVRGGIFYIVLPTSMAMAASERQAKEIAIHVRNALGGNATVIVKSPAGQRLAQSDMWGTR